MIELQHSSEGSSSSSTVESVAGSVVTRLWNPKLPKDFNAGLFTVGVVSLMIVMQIKDTVRIGFLDDIKRLISHPPEEVGMPQHWNYSSLEFRPVISGWDEQRLRWLEGDVNSKGRNHGARPRVLMVTGSSQDEGELYLLSHLLLRAAKNKQDYTQMHDMELYYNMINPDPAFSDWWVKLPVLRMLMLRHPEVEWLWWIDADAVITNMTLEPPFADLDRYNLVLYGGELHENLGSTGLSTASFMIRNCQWSLDLLGAWAYSGTDSNREEAASDVTFPEEMEVRRTMNVVPDDDRSSLVAILAQDRRNPPGDQKWVSKVKLVEETAFVMNKNWTVLGPKLEELSLEKALPFVTHFGGCLPHPSEVARLSRQDLDNFNACVEQLERAFDLSENQVYKELGLERSSLGNSSVPFTWKGAPNESAETASSLPPSVTAWDQKRKAYMQSRPWIEQDLAVLLSGSPPTPCMEKEGSHLLLRGLKNKIDYSRLHGIRMFYNMAVIHQTLKGSMSKLPAIKLLMVNSPDVEWIWWTDSDAVFTSMDHRIPFERYNANGYNLVLWGGEHEVFDLKRYNGISTGDMFIRNCQWSLDLLDRWASLGNLTEDSLGTLLDRPPIGPADDQSSLVYLLIVEREKWAPKVHFENEMVLSGEWHYWSSLFVDDYKMREDQRPLMTHFTGCYPCSKEKVGFELCLEKLQRTYTFADNQVLENYGLRHEHLNSSRIVDDLQGDVPVWTPIEIEGMVNKSSKELSASNKEVEDVTTKEEEEQVTSTKQEEQVTTKEEEKEQQGVTESKEEEKEVPTDEEQGVDLREEKLGRPEESEPGSKIPEGKEALNTELEIGTNP